MNLLIDEQLRPMKPAAGRGAVRAVRLALFVAAASMLGVAMTLYSTKLGVDVSGDSVVYLEAARNVIAHRGLQLIAPDGHKTPLIVFPPAYPVMLATGGAIGLDPISFARLLNCFALIVTLLFVALIVARGTGKLWPIAIAMALCLVSRPFMFGYTRLLSEAPFVALAMGALYFLIVYVQTRSRSALVLAALFIAAGGLTRYAGVSLAFVGVGAIFIVKDRPWRSRMIDLVILVLIVGIAMEAWAIRNGAPAKPYGGRTFALHPAPAAKLLEGARSLGEWIGAREIPGTAWLGSLLAAALVVVALVRRNPASRICALFVVVYLGFVLVSLTFFDAAIPLNSRMWLPVVPALVVLLALTIDVLATRPSTPPSPEHGRRGSVLAISVVVIAAIAMNSYLSAKFAYSLHRNGQGYLSAVWRKSGLIAAVKKLPGKTPIASNAQDAIYVLTSRRAYGLPMARFRTIAQDNPHLRDDLIQLERQLGKKGVLAYSTRIKRGDFLPSEKRIQKFISLDKIADLPDGRLYRVKRSRRPLTTQP